MTLRTLFVGAFLFLISNSAALQAEAEIDNSPTEAELLELVDQWWPSFSRRLQLQDRLTESPSRLTGLPKAICRKVIPRTYECVSFVEYEYSSGTHGNALMRHSVSRDTNGKLFDAIIVVETPAPK